ncbi:MAG: EAL domain-containing protein [Sulfurospirillum sp.]|nr:EAL domain-containing protein [Sulfurospirillum sp.]
MACKKCEEKFELQELASNIYFMSDVKEVTLKCIKFFDKIGLHVEHKEGIVFAHVDNAANFFYENIDYIKSSFSDIEKNSIRIFIEDVKNPFGLQAVLGAKSLQVYINFLCDKDFFDIINNESITSHFQPILSHTEKNIFGYEALARGVKQDGSLMFPDELFTKSAQNNMNFKVDRLCRESALKNAAVKKITQKVFINFIPTTIYDPKFCLASTVKWANQLEFDPKNIIFEVIETEQAKDVEHLKNILLYYRKQGYKIALDDVGAGYSGLNLLIDLHPDIIKVDRKIIDGIDRDSLKQSIYKALYDICRMHDITVLAEGIETPYEYSFIESVGVDLMQGYYFAKPTAEPVRQIKRIF